MSKINKIRLSGTDYDIQDVSATSVVELTQQQYDNLPATAKTSNILYIITDAQAGDLTNYYTKTETNTLLGGKQDTLVSGTNIKTINNTSLLGSGNIDIQGGGKAIEAGRGIYITTGATADTVSLNLPISAGTGTNSVAEGSGTTASGNQSHAEGSGTTASSYQCHAEGYDTKASGRCSHAEGSGTKASGDFSHAEGFSTTASGSQSHAEGLLTKANGNHSHAEGNWTTASGDYSHAEGRYTVTKNEAEHASGQYNVSNSATTEFGDSGNTLFSVGNGTADNARHNAFEIRQNGDIYLSSGGTDIKLQDHLGGGGGGGTVESAITSGSTNAVESKAIWSATTFNKDVLLTFNGVYSTNYPNGCTKLIVEVVGNDVSTMTFYNDDQNLGKITITNFGSIAVYNSFNGASYEISGTTVLITYPTVTNVTKISMDNGKYVYTAVVEGAWVNENTYMKPEVDSIATSLQNNINSKQDTLVSGTNIKTINNESILGEGNIDIQGGGKAIEAGRGISITTGETADTVSFNLPISAGTGTNSVAEGSGTTASGDYSHAEGSGTYAMSRYSHAEGYQTIASGWGTHAEGNNTQANAGYSHAEGISTIANGAYSHAEGNETQANGSYSHAEGQKTTANNQSEHASGQYNVSSSASTTFGDSGNTLFSVGNGTSTSARHNAFEIRQNADIYITLNGQDVKLQDQLGGGGSSYTAGDGIDITNNVISVTGKVDTTTYETYTAATDTAIAGKQDILTGGNGIDINNDVISVTGKADTSAVTAIQDSLSGYVTTDTEQTISGRKIFTYASNTSKAIVFKQTSPSNKVGFVVINSAPTNNELASFELRPNTFTVDGVQHPLLYFGHYRSTATASAGVPQTYIGFRQYDQLNAAAYHYLMPLPEKAKTPFNLTASFKDYYAPIGFKNGSTMITADNTGVVDLSSEFSGKADTATTYTKTEVDTALSGKVDTSAITTSVTSSSTDAQVPSAKAVYDIVGDIETLLSQI